MSKQTVAAMVTGGKATAGPPLGPALGPLGVKIPEIIAKINEKTKDLAGMSVPVKVIVDTDTKAVEIVVGTPPVSALIKKELNLEKGGAEPGKLRVGDLTPQQVSKIAKAKFGTDATFATSQVAGTARSMGISVGRGAVTREEVASYEAMKKAEEAAAAEKAAAKAAATPAPAAGAAPAAGEKAEAAKEEKKPAAAKPAEKKK
ncbi:MAG: hypothetical protein HY369_01915 [Candidatus Aenigmarchaeota archaeon]|nr:hypothetical protein [Candidatus Aenigmarchaeota archaeon]